MPRRKSLLAQMYEARQKARLQQQKLEEQAVRAWAAEDRRVAAQAEKEAAQLCREEERAAQARLREEQQAERTRQQAAAKAERLAAQQAREQERQAAAQARKQQQREAAERRDQQASEADRRRAVERRVAEAEFRTEAVRAAATAFERLLADRNRDLVAHSRGAEAIFNAHGPDAFVAAIQQALATSGVPTGPGRVVRGTVHPGIPRVVGGVRAASAGGHPRSHRLSVREDQGPHPGRAAQASGGQQMYEKLIGRVALRTLAEAFDVAPATLVGGIVFNGYVSAKDRATGKPVRPLADLLEHHGFEAHLVHPLRCKAIA
jgi:restriction system protein